LAGILSRVWDFVRKPLGKAPSPRDRREAERALSDRLVTGYRPTLSGAGFWGENDTPDLARMLSDVSAMLAHPRVSHSLEYFKSGIAKAQFAVEDASSPKAGEFCLEEAERFWSKHRWAAQTADEYGRGGAELVYAEEGGLLRLAAFDSFAGVDCYPLVAGGKYAGIRLRRADQIKGSHGRNELWGPRPGLPAKGWWYAPNRRHSRWYGMPRLYPAWRPWRRLAGRDGAEDIVDGGVYRFAFMPYIGRYPDEDRPVNPGGVQTSSRDKMRQFLEEAKAGAVVALSSRRDENGQYVWDITPVQGALDVSGLVAYTDNLEKAISLGCGVPPELIEASEVGSGWSGRAIPMVGYYTVQQGVAEGLLDAWYRQIGEPLLAWNFGPGSWARLKVGDLLKTLMGTYKGEEKPEQGGGPAGAPPAAAGGGGA
jgi:hypothetical protein